MKKSLGALCLTAGLLCGAVSSAFAVDFKAQGEWLFGWGGVESTMEKNRNAGQDVFNARQRIRLQMDAVASEALSGTLRLQIGTMDWGRAGDGAALGADGVQVRVHDAYITWMVPNTELSLRMGIQSVALPNAAGGSAVLDEQVAGIVGSWRFNDTVALTAMWLRPYNDNYTGFTTGEWRQRNDPNGYQDNVDYFGLSLPLKFEGVSVTPWALLGFMGRNAIDILDAPFDRGGEAIDGPTPYYNLPVSYYAGDVVQGSMRGSRPYATQFYAGLPLTITALDPWNFELDINYGYSQGFGNYLITDRLGNERRADSQRQGWLVKGLAEYQFDWGAPGLLGWYASGDDGSLKNGSERMPAIAPAGNFTSFMQDGPEGWSLNGGFDKMLDYGGTWGLGLQLRDLTFVEDLKHTLRVVYWGGTNSASMIRKLPPTNERRAAWNTGDGMYLTTLDHLVEFNLDTQYKIYENLEAVVELGYIVNGFDKSAWRKNSDFSYQNADAWKAAVLLRYTF